jgi:hypothetical protein
MLAALVMEVHHTPVVPLARESGAEILMQRLPEMAAD